MTARNGNYKILNFMAQRQSTLEFQELRANCKWLEGLIVYYDAKIFAKNKFA